jgi:hypothetical protein
MIGWAEEHGHVTRVKYLSAMPGTTVYNNGIRDGHIKSEVDHLNWLATEQALVQDEFLNYTSIGEGKLRTAYKRIYDSYQPGPVMDFVHWPEHFSFFQPNQDDGATHSVDYAGDAWRDGWSSAGPGLAPGCEKYTLDHAGTPRMAALGSRKVGDWSPDIVPGPRQAAEAK